MSVPKLAHWSAAYTAIAAGSLDPNVIAAAEAEILVGQATGVLDNKAVSGDVTIAATGAVTIGDGKVGPTKLDNANDYIMGTLETAGKIIAAGGIVTENKTHTGVALADLTAVFGAPATLDNGAINVYTNSTDGKVYLVTVVGSTFYISAFMTAVSA